MSDDDGRGHLSIWKRSDRIGDVITCYGDYYRYIVVLQGHHSGVLHQ